MKLRNLSLEQRIFFLVLIIIFICVSIVTLFIKNHLRNSIIGEGERKAFTLAEMVASDPKIIDAFNLSNPASVIQPIVERIRLSTDAGPIIVFNMDGVRYSHPQPDHIGEKINHIGEEIGLEGDRFTSDEEMVLSGKKWVSQKHGALGISLRAFVPISNRNNQQIGAVSVGVLLTEIQKQQREVISMLYLIALASILIGLGGAVLLAKNVKKSTFGLEPHEIAVLLEERNVILSSIKEGIVAIDRENRVILMNDTAKKIFGLRELPANCLITDILPDTKLPQVVETGDPIFDDEHVVKGTVVLVNRVPLVSEGQIIGGVATFRDMSEIRKLAEELTEVKKYINALRQQRHEHLNKLHVISGLLQLRRYKEATNFVVNTVSKEQKIADLIRSRVKTPLISGLILAMAYEAESNNIEFFIDPESYFPKISENASVPVVTIIGNILENSIESLILSAKRNRKISLSFDETEDLIRIVIKDNGDGFPVEWKEKVFERGFTTKKSSKNMGMGLFLVKNEVERLHGTIEIDVENGVEFSIRLPKSFLM